MATRSICRPTRWAATRRRLAGPSPRRRVRQSVLHADPSDVHSASRRLPVEADANVGVAPQRRPDVGAEERRGDPAPDQIPESDRDYYLERKYPGYGNLVPREVSSRKAKRWSTRAMVSGREDRRLPRLRRSHRTPRPGDDQGAVRELFDMYDRITGENPYQVPMRIYPAPITRWAGCQSTTS